MAGLLLVLAADLFVSVPVSAQARVLATGEGFQLTEKDIQKLKAFYAERNFFTTKEQYLQGALKLKLFAMEARAQELVQAANKDKDKDESVKELINLSGLYIRKLLDEYPLDEGVIESYYRAHPEKYGLDENGEDAVQPLDDFLKEQIRWKILTAKKQVVAAEALEKLKLKYKVRIVDPGEQS